MSKHSLRHVVGALICGLVPLIPLIPVGSVSASSPIHVASPAPTASGVSESAVLQKFRDSGPPTMEAASQFEATAPIQNYAPVKLAKTQVIQGVSNPRLFSEVFGFAFASSLGDPTIGYPSWNFGLLSTVAYFGIHVDWTGHFSGGSALDIWNDPNGPVPGFIQTAHASGTKVVLTIAMFDSTSGTPNMCSALQRGSLTIQDTVAQVLAKGIDGVNVDYESNNTACTDPGTGIVASSQSLFTTFVKNLRAALPASSYLSLDSYSGAAGYRDCGTCPFLGFFDIGALANYVDSFFVMAYDMEYSNWDSAPLNCASFCLGPTAPLSTYLFNDSRASSEYRAVVPASKIIMGIPYYGRKECVPVNPPSQIPPNAIGTSVAADGYLDAQAENGYPGNTLYTANRDANDPSGATRWDTFSSVTAGCNREMYWDDATALGNKYNLIINDHLRGAGIFALNYGGGAPELWNLINLKFGQCSQAAITADKTVPQIPGTAIKFTGSALCAGTAQYEFLLQPPGGSLSLIQSYSGSNTWTWQTTPTTPLGTYTIEVAAKNLGAVASYDTSATMSFRLALCSTPALSADRASPQLPGTLVTLTAVGTCSGTPQYRYWKTAPGGVKTMVQDYSSTATFAWDTSGGIYGAYSFAVDVRVPASTLAAEASQTIAFSLTSCITPVLTTDKTSPQPTGTQVGLSGSATCVGTPQYRFMIQPPGGTFTVVQDFSSTSTFTWIGSGIAGTYGLELDARGAGAATATMFSTEISFDLVSCSAVTLATSLPSPQVPGPSVVLTATATCPGTAQYRFSITNPAGASSVVQNYGSANTYSWNTTALPLGGYGLTVDVRNVGAIATSEASASVTFTLANPACTTPTLTSDLGSPQGAGAVITFSATTTTCPSPLYSFYFQPPNGVWTLTQDYSTSPTFKWHQTGPGGTYGIEVWVRDSTRPVSYDQYTVIRYVITACTGATLTPSVPSPQAAATQVILSGTAAGCPNPLYQFWILAPKSSAWTIVQAYSTNATFNWNTTGLSAGSYLYTVWVRDATSVGWSCSGLGCSDAYSPATAYVLTTQPCASVTDSAAPPATSAAGTAIMFTAAASGCANPLYQFWILAPGSTTWTIAQAYSTAATFSWNTSALPPGSYRYTVWVRDASSVGTSCGSLGCSDAYFPATAYSLTPAPCTAVTESAAPASPSTAGTSVTFTALASGCPNPRYQFWMLAPGSSMWTVVQAYSSSATFNWNSTGKPAGTYRYTVWARDASSAGSSGNNLGSFDAFFAATAYTLNSTPCTAVSESAAAPSTSPVGTSVIFTAIASGCPNPLYQFWILAPGSTTWTIAQPYSTTATLTWNTTGKPAGTYRYTVWVRDSSSAGTSSNNLGSFDAFFAVTTYTLTTQPCTSVTESAAPATTAVSGTSVTFTAVASGCSNPLYQFWILAPGSTTWTIAQAYSSNATFTWNTTGKPAGTYRFTVWVRDASSAGTSSNNLGSFDAVFPATAYTLS